MKPFVTRKRVLLFLVLFILIGTGSIVLKQKTENRSQSTPETPAALTVTTESPKEEYLPLTITANGNLVAWHEAIIGTETQGLRLSEVYVDVGDQVKKGQIIAKFAPEMVKADLEQAKATLAEAEAAAAEARLNADRARKLRDTGALSTSQIDQYLAAEQTTLARVGMARAQVEQQQVRFNHTLVKAPDYGLISSRTATVGNVLNTGTELFRLIRQNRLEWRAELTASELSQISPGTQVQLTTAGGQTLNGKVRTIGPAINLETRNALVYVDLPTEAQQMGARAGMFARGTFEIGRKTALTVSQSAVVIRDGFRYIYTVGPDDLVEQHKIELGRLYQDRFEIISGLSPDARVVSSGASFLNHGDRVRINTLPPAVSPETTQPSEKAGMQ